MNPPSPVLIAQSAVRPFPRWALLLFCAAYVLPGFIGRSPWKNEDIAAFGVMQELSGFPGSSLSSSSSWFAPQLLGQTAGFDALIPYWLGALAIEALPFLDAAYAARVPFVLLLALTFFCLWNAVYFLARSPQAQPVSFAFGGEAHPVDYARAMADAALLALIASLGLAQLSHETTPALAQLGFSSLALCAMAAAPYRLQGLKAVLSGLGVVVGLTGLALSGAPTLALLLGCGSACIEYWHMRPVKNKLQNLLYTNAVFSSDETLEVDKQNKQANATSPFQQKLRRWLPTLQIAFATLLASAFAWYLDLWRWRIDLPGSSGFGVVAADGSADILWRDLRSLGRLLLWFTWPAWPLALWTLWRWRKQLSSRHVALPLWCVTVALAASVSTDTSERSLLLALPPLAALAAFALPTFKRGVASLIDWFTLLFFSGWALVIWVIWVAMQTGLPRQPAANVAKLAPGFEPSFSAWAFVFAVIATGSWLWLVRWRTKASRAAVWKSLVLPAAGATLCWLLLMTLWLPLLDYVRSLAPISRQIGRLVQPQQLDSCVEIYGLSNAQIAALRYHAQLQLRPAGPEAQCSYLVVDIAAQPHLSHGVNLPDWAFQATVRRPMEKGETLLLYRRIKLKSDLISQ